MRCTVSILYEMDALRSRQVSRQVRNESLSNFATNQIRINTISYNTSCGTSACMPYLFSKINCFPQFSINLANTFRKTRKQIYVRNSETFPQINTPVLHAFHVVPEKHVVFQPLSRCNFPRMYEINTQIQTRYGKRIAYSNQHV